MSTGKATPEKNDWETTFHCFNQSLMSLTQFVFCHVVINLFYVIRKDTHGHYPCCSTFFLVELNKFEDITNLKRIAFAQCF